MATARDFGRTLLLYRKQLIVMLTPILLLPLPLAVPGQTSLCGYCMLLMAVYWCTEAMPLAVTSLIPLFLFPLLNILTADKVAEQYFKEIAWMFTGGLMVALAIERSNLHRRVALGILVLVGTQPAWLMLGFMLPTWFLSMWISNTATTSMMIPIMEAVLHKLEHLADVEAGVVEGEEEEGNDMLLKDKKVEANGVENEEAADPAISETPDVLVPSPKSAHQLAVENMGKAMTLSVAYAANVGGLGTLTGTTPNIIMKDAADKIWIEHGYTESPVNFASWMVFSFPIALFSLVIIWIWLVCFYLGPRAFLQFGKRVKSKGSDVVSQTLAREQSQLPSLTWAEGVVGVFFLLMAMLWFFRSPGFISGWGNLFGRGYVKDAVVSIFIPVMLCFIPRERPTLQRYKTQGQIDPVLDWDFIEKNLPWGVLVLIGGGMALAEASVVSGLSLWISSQLTVFGGLPSTLMIALVTLIVSFLTELTSNTATCTIVMPICASMAEGLGLNPLYIMFPAALGTGLAFLLPVATPPNAIVFSYKRLTVLDMVKAGLVLKLLIFVPTLAAETWGYYYFDMAHIPWNVTAPIADVVLTTVSMATPTG